MRRVDEGKRFHYPAASSRVSPANHVVARMEQSTPFVAESRAGGSCKAWHAGIHGPGRTKESPPNKTRLKRSWSAPEAFVERPMKCDFIRPQSE